MRDHDTVVRHTTATGGHVTISLPGFVLDRPATSHTVAEVAGDRQEFVTGTRRFAHAAAVEAGGVDLDLSYSMAGGRLLAGSAPVPGAPDQVHTAIAWIGRRWSLYMFSANATPETLIEVLALVEPEEAVGGLVLRPSHRDLRWEEPAQLTKVVPDLGLLDISPMHARTRSGIPRWAGTRARGGELYVDRSNPDQTVYTIANRDSATRVLPGRTTRRATLERGLGRILVSHADDEPTVGGRTGRDR